MSSDNNNSEHTTGHEYDGIKENNFPMPAWWLAIFVGTIIFSFNYYIHYTFAEAPTLLEEFQEQMKKVDANPERPLPQESELKALHSRPEIIAAGIGVYQQKCSMCHGPDGGGTIGPNLTDDHWIHGTGQRRDILNVLIKGVPDKGMPAWGKVLTSEEMSGISAYVFSLRGTKPSQPKAAEGNLAPSLLE